MLSAVQDGASPENQTFLFRDDFILAIEKASGEIVHRGWGRDGPVLLDRVRATLKAERKGTKLHPIHRLDRGTSGVVVIALDPDSARTLSECWGSEDVVKRYIALVRGESPEGGEIDHPIPRRVGGPRVPAVSTYRRLATSETEPRTTTLVEVMPRTGRLHQVRRHLKHINHPVIGDSKYGRGRLNRAMAEGYGLRRLALHAASISFPHPKTGEVLHLSAKPPTDLSEPLAAMGFEAAIQSYSMM